MDEAVQTTAFQRARGGQWLARAWDRFLEVPVPFLVAGLIGVALISFTGGILWGPALCGLAAMGVRRHRLRRTETADFFQGFTLFVPSILSGILVLCFSLAGLVFLIVPGLVIFAMYLFTFHFIADQGEDFWQAMESSRKLVSQDYFGYTLFATILVFINFLGILFFGVGVVATLSITSLAVTEAYLDMSDQEHAPSVEPDSPPVTIE